MKKKIIALVAALGISLAVISPANAWYRGGWGYGGWGGYGWGGYGAGLGIMAGSALLGGVIGGAIASGGGYGYGGGYYGGGYGYAPMCGVTAVPYYDFYGNFVGYRRQTVC